MRRIIIAGMAVLVGLNVFAQQPTSSQRPPWSEQPPLAQPGQRPGAPPVGLPPDNDGYAPDRGVARVSFMNGNVSVRRGDSGDMVAAILNAPLAAGDRVVTADGARAEVQLDSANLIRLGPATEVRFSELQYSRFHMQIATGTASFRVLRDSTAEIEISTPSISIRPLKKGTYRVTLRPDGTSEITVRGGEAEVFGPRGSEQIQSGSTMIVRGSSDEPEFQIVGAPAEDDLDRWAASRDQQMERATAPRYVSRDVYGVEDLDPYGRWVNDPNYGNVWAPTAVDPGWAPYQCGRWVWMDYYGWTWVGCEPWAWAPYHYGRWFYGSFGWAWWPGPVYAHYYWRPALVGFFGWGGGVGFGVGFGFGFGNIGWVPLAPYERFYPWYGGFRGPAIVNNINITNVYRNARVTNGVTSMQASQFGRTGISNANLVRASAGDLARAGAVRGNLPVTPSAESRQFSSRATTGQGLPRTNENTRFFSRSASPAANRTAGPAATQSNGGWQRLSPGNVNPGNAGARLGSSTGPTSSGSSSGGWQRFEGANRGYSGAPAARQGLGAETQRSAPGGYGGYSAPRSQPQVRVSPPIVQNRGSVGGGRSSGGSARGGGGRSEGHR